MRYGILADIHGNIEALHAVLTDSRAEHVDTYCCCGDIVGYGADPTACIQEINVVKAQCVAGNHDWAAIRKTATHRFHEQALMAIEWTRQHLTKADKEFLTRLPLLFSEKNFTVVHSTLDQPEKFLYLTDPQEAKQMFSVMDRQVCFVGHSHVAGIFVEQGNGKIVMKKDGKVSALPECRYIINVGSVGQPRDRNPDAAYCIFDDEARTAVIKRVPYDINTAKNKIIKAGLPSGLGMRLLSGI